MILTTESINNSENFVKSITLVDKLNIEIESMGGYVAHNNHHILFIIKE